MSDPVQLGAEPVVSPEAVTLQTRKRVGMPSRRGRYVSNACVSCQLKKVKCSGDDVCQQCQLADNECLYAVDRRRSSHQAKPTMTSRKPRPIPAALNRGKNSHEALLDALSHLSRRIEDLERRRRKPRSNSIATTTSSVDKARFPSGDYERSFSEDVPADQLESLEKPYEENVRGSTSLSEVISVLDSYTAEQPDDSTPSDRSVTTAHTSAGVMNLPQLAGKSLRRLLLESKDFSVEDITCTVDTFFSHIHPLWPCLDEVSFRKMLHAFASSDERHPTVATQQFAAQLNLIRAIIQCLNEVPNDLGLISGWLEFCRAEHIVYRLVWLGNGNLMTVQCLVLKAMYHVYSTQHEPAYTTMGHAVRLCFQLGLHSKQAMAKWSGSDLGLRQSTFYTVLFLDNHIAFGCGAPPLIRDVDYDIEPPQVHQGVAKANDDSILCAPSHVSPSSWLACCAVWAKLLSEIWFRAFAVNAQEKCTLEFIALTDARIQYLCSTFPPSFQSLQAPCPYLHPDQFTPSVRRQRWLLLLRQNQVKLLIRQDIMLSLKYDTSAASSCLSVAASTIDAIVAYVESPGWLVIDRFVCVLYATGALLSLVCLLIKGDNPSSMKEAANSSFTKGLEFLNQLSRRNCKAACSALQRLNRVIDRAQQAVAQSRAGDVAFGDVSVPSDDADTLMHIEPLIGFCDGADIDESDFEKLLHQLPEFACNLDELGIYEDPMFFCDISSVVIQNTREIT